LLHDWQSAARATDRPFLLESWTPQEADQQPAPRQLVKFSLIGVQVVRQVVNNLDTLS